MHVHVAGGGGSSGYSDFRGSWKHVAGGWGLLRVEGYSDLGSWNIHACMYM